MMAADMAKRCSALEHIADFLSNVLQSGGLFICSNAARRGMWAAHLRAFPQFLPRRISPGGAGRAHKHVRVLCAKCHSIVRSEFIKRDMIG